MIRVGIVEDDAISRKLILDYLTRYESEHDESFDVSVFEDGSQIVRNYRPRFDIILLDIQMPDVDGMSAAKHIRSIDEQVVLVFITSSPQFAIKGYEVDATSYLLKPLPWFAFEQELTRAIATVRKRKNSSLIIQSGTDVIRLSIEDVVYVESVKHRLEIHTVDGAYSISGTLKDMEAQLDGHDFFRSNSCYLVNLAHVQGVRDQSCIMTGGMDLRISRPRKKLFMTALATYAGGIR
ncbi:LytR/AlgR family response regulator transcription factor [Actinomyces mediterranea]|uniref:LytR/AlgR family response regulator transcription factor n=1 Tax=Actinomyces mediterranea TaxID=1871028 RepID=UPI0009704935|nr:LytTR family DNA-binding domain-containing protein [Actinomyces mediterranea]